MQLYDSVQRPPISLTTVIVFLERHPIDRHIWLEPLSSGFYPLSIVRVSALCVFVILSLYAHRHNRLCACLFCFAIFSLARSCQFLFDNLEGMLLDLIKHMIQVFSFGQIHFREVVVHRDACRASRCQWPKPCLLCLAAL